MSCLKNIPLPLPCHPSEAWDPGRTWDIFSPNSPKMNNNQAPSNGKTSLLERYLEFCEREEKQRTLWFIIPLMVLSAAVMPISIFLMSYFDFFIAFIAVSILLFFTNIILSIAEQPTKVTISFFLFTVLFHFGVPLVCFVADLIRGRYALDHTYVFQSL
mgnify:CR=1 FL=1